MITFTKYVKELSRKAGVTLSSVEVTDGKEVGCLDTHLLSLITDDHKKEYVLIYQNDLDLIEQGKGCNRLEAKVVKALSKLK
jgi:hypothetical protein